MPILARKLTFTYNKGTPFQKKALDNIDLEIHDGEFVAVVGRTGSGKTTFVQHLNALVRLQEGELCVQNINLAAKKVDLKKLRGEVGMVFQYPEYQLFADSVEADVMFGPKNMGLSKEECAERAKTALDTVGLNYDEIRSKSPFDLSGGEKRRVAFAGVLAMRPTVLVLDEPTAGLDPQGKREILSLVKKLNKDNGVTVIMVSHDMNEVYENADRIIVFDDGKVAADDVPEKLFKREDDVKNFDLEVPYMAQFRNALEKGGFELSGNPKKVEEVFGAVAVRKGGGNVS